LAFPIQVHQCARWLLFCGCDFRSWWCCLHIILDWLLASWATDLWSGAPAIYFGCLQKFKQGHSIGRWFLSQLDCKYPRCSICWCYCQIPWALGHSLWGGFATWGRRLIYAVFQYLAITQRSLLTGAYFRVRWHMAFGTEYGNHGLQGIVILLCG
jgi:hypothetical protein